MVYPRTTLTYERRIGLWSFPERTTFEEVDSKSEYIDVMGYYYIRWGNGGFCDGYYSSPAGVLPAGYSQNKPYQMIYNIKVK